MIKYHSSKSGMAPTDYTIPEVHDRRRGLGSDSENSGFNPSSESPLKDGLDTINDSISS